VSDFFADQGRSTFIEDLAIHGRNHALPRQRAGICIALAKREQSSAERRISLNLTAIGILCGAIK